MKKKIVSAAVGARTSIKEDQPLFPMKLSWGGRSGGRFVVLDARILLQFAIRWYDHARRRVPCCQKCGREIWFGEEVEYSHEKCPKRKVKHE